VASDAAGNTYQDRRLADGSVTRIVKNFPTETSCAVAWNAISSTRSSTTTGSRNIDDEGEKQPMKRAGAGLR